MSQYRITDGRRFIQKDIRGKYVPTSCESFADVFGKKQAENIYNSQLPKALRKVFRIEKYDIPPENIKQVTQKDLLNTEKVLVADNIQKWIDRFTNLNGIMIDALRRREELTNELSKLEQELMDINHYIEFCNLNAAQGYKAYKMIKDRRMVRRTVKNELAVLDIISSNKIAEITTDEIQRYIAKLDKRYYKPRVLNELFDV